ncbi:putative TetR family transcriptional regulator [Kitasatospora setae KM-6054]|uniref:Putative TetR family transcriptional regulator n=1 Tax=Kitasatospora setae (strain ATCC 33774 / DSM 43861 / JCM 3304 / KCC A-0304 / NBRC 14216 / KM-6054) TaxID=452652 RepID=E4N951_KITSK|nr:putative TetR family transcriptional regulator [Kitasatospora setae KM-6054]
MNLIPFGRPPAERADAARNREALLCTARAMIAEAGVDQVTMDGLAERAGLGKGTVFRRFGTRAGIFRALLDAEEYRFQEQVLAGPPPLGPGADPVDRLIAYGRARTSFLLDRRDIARAGLERKGPVPPLVGAGFSHPHIRMLLGQAGLGLPDPDTLAVQLTSALDGPALLFLTADRLPPEPSGPCGGGELDTRLGDSWQTLVERLARR